MLGHNYCTIEFHKTADCCDKNVEDARAERTSPYKNGVFFFQILYSSLTSLSSISSG